ncbi:MAG: glycosyltransferase family 2 protein [Deltaproteobacteria bacterium]|nr:glycosyltransferase family 2 protein [Deltaproteobacteria bacterium]
MPVEAIRLSAIIPTWCETDGIAAAVRAAAQVADEVIVVDASSPDDTADRARNAGARVFIAPKGRGPQLDAGARAATGDVLLFLHADVRLPAAGRGAMHAALADPEVLGGNFRLVFTPRSGWSWAFSAANDIRRRALSIYYGDSALFVRRRVFDDLGGFGALPVMEDYAFIRRLEAAGRTAYIRDVEVTASSRRFARAPVRTALIWGLMQGLYSSGVPVSVLSRLYADIR